VREDDRRRSQLSRREREVLQLLAEGHEVRAIAAALALSPDTVRAHLRSARSRLRARSRAHAVALALVGGQIEPVSRRLEALPARD
jgi:DNA-binding CsgD family transcriptional regulator